MSAIPSATIAGGSSAQNSRHASDFYETPPECTVALMRHLPEWRKRGTWEPACGDGAIGKVLRDMCGGQAVVETDLRITARSLGGVDFLRQTRMPEGTHQIITNPPFNLAAEFIRHARSFGVPFALLLKSTFWHAAERRALFVETSPVKVLPLGWRPAMAPDRGGSPTMEFSWTVWAAAPSVSGCEYYPLVKP